MFDQHIGKHCFIDVCKQKDWLPVKCKYCSKVFCADHCSIDSHSCPNYQRQFKKVYSCPLCNKILNMNSSLSVQENFSIHQALDCKGNFEQNIVKPNKCSGTNCKANITSLNQFECSKCRKKVCLKHRMPEDHKCTKK